MPVIEFRSLKEPQHVFAVMPSALNDDRWNYTDKAIAPQIVWADCMGDYPTRHTPYGVVVSERLEEVLHALATHLAADPTHVRLLSDIWPREPHADHVLALHKLKYNPAKPTYYTQYGETSVAKSKKGESGWYEVPTWANGANDPAQIYGLYPQYQHHALHQFVWMAKVMRVLPGSWRMPERFLPYGLKERANYLAHLLASLQATVDAYRETKRAADALDTYNSMIEFDKTKK